MSIEQNHQSSKKTVVGIIHQGPLPSPDILARYEQVQPGFADRVVKLAENEASHRHEIDKTYLNKTFSQQRLGQIFGFAIGVIAIVAGVYAAIHGSQWAGSIVGGGVVVGLVSIFVIGKRIKD